MNIKFTELLRRIDDLGRVVIPKNIRKELNIKEGEPLDIYIYEDNESYGVLFRKMKIPQDNK